MLSQNDLDDRKVVTEYPEEIYQNIIRSVSGFARGAQVSDPVEEKLVGFRKFFPRLGLPLSW
jgi:hypothetical protein